MALLGNGGLHARGPVRNFGILSPGTERSSWQQSGQLRNFPLHEERPTGGDKTGYPSGRVHPYSWSMPAKPGGMASIGRSQGSATVSGSGAMGVNGSVGISGSSVVAATGRLVVSGSSSISGSASVSANVRAALNGSASISGSASVSAAVSALAWANTAIAGAASVTSVPFASGRLVCSIAPAITLEASNFSTYLLDQEDIETGMTLRQAMRLVAAATAGKISGANGTTVTIRGAVADGHDRIVATVDASGNRTAITYDLDD